jgi:hypothetical protein
LNQLDHELDDAANDVVVGEDTEESEDEQSQEDVGEK